MSTTHEPVKHRIPQSADKYILRFSDEGLRKQLKIRAAQNERTLNAEITYLIKRGLESEKGGAQ